MPTFVKVGENSLSTGVAPISLRIHFWLSSFGWMRSPRIEGLNAGGVSVGYWVGCGRFSHRMVHGLLYGLETKMRRMSVLLFMVRRWRWNICRLPESIGSEVGGEWSPVSFSFSE